MLKTILSRTGKAGLDGRITTHFATVDTIGAWQDVDFALAFWMIHEVPDKEKFLSEIRATLKPDGLFLLVEPALHVTRRMFDKTAEIAFEAGFVMKGRPRISLSQSLLLQPRMG